MTNSLPPKTACELSFQAVIKFPFLSRRLHDTRTIIQETPYRETSETSAAIHQNIFPGVFPIETYKKPVKKSKMIRSPRETDRMLVAHTAKYYILCILAQKWEKVNTTPQLLSACKNRLRDLVIKLSRSPAPKNINHFWKKLHYGNGILGKNT